MFNGHMHRDFELEYNNLRYDVSDSNCYTSGTGIYDLTQRKAYQDGLLVGNPTINANSVTFNGTTQYIKLPRSSSQSLMTPAKNFSFGAWVKPSATITMHWSNWQSTIDNSTNLNQSAGQRFLFYPGNSANDLLWCGLSVGTNGVQVYERSNNLAHFCVLHNVPTLQPSPTPPLWSEVSLPSDRFTFVMVVVQDGYPRIYINGVDYWTYHRSANINSFTLNHIRLGGGCFYDNTLEPAYASYTDTFGYYQGEVGMVYVFNKPITDLMVKSIYAAYLDKY